VGEVDVEPEGPSAVVEMETVFALAGDVLETGGFVPGTRGVVDVRSVVIVPGASNRLKVGMFNTRRPWESGSKGREACARRNSYVKLMSPFSPRHVRL